MSDFKEEIKNKNFVAGWKYCDDLPSLCDCGIERTLPIKPKRFKVAYSKKSAGLQEGRYGMEGSLIFMST